MRDVESRPKAMGRWLAVVVALGLGMVAMLPRAASAAPCCMSATAFGVGRLLIWEDFALGVRTALGSAVGGWDHEGAWQGAGDYGEHEWRSEVWALVGLDRRASISLRVPAVVLARSTLHERDLGGGLGDVAAGLRYELLAIGEILELPAIAATIAVVAPTGRAPEDAKTPLAVDVTGRGAWVIALGVELEVTRLPWYARLDLGVSVPLPNRRDDLGAEQRLGVALEVAVAGGLEVADDVVLSLVPRFTWGEETHLGDKALAGSGRRELGLTLAGSWRFDPRWTLQASVDGPIAVDQVGMNQSGRVTTTLGLRYGSF